MRVKGHQSAESLISVCLLFKQGMEIVQTMNSDPGLAVGKTRLSVTKTHDVLEKQSKYK